MKKINKKLFTIMAAFLFAGFSTTASGQTASLDNLQGTTGTQVLVPLNFSNMNNLGAVTLFITFDPTVLSFNGITNIWSGAANTLANVMNNPTRVAISWFALSGGVNFPNGKYLDLNFTYNSCTNAPLTFTSACEIVTWDGTILTVNYNNGGVNNGPSTAVWTGAGMNNDWFNASNWSTAVPGCVTDVTINAAGNNYPIISANKTDVIVNNLLIQPFAGLTVLGNLTIQGNLTVQPDGSLIENGTVILNGQKILNRNVNVGDNLFHFISIPTDNVQAGVFLGQYLRFWVEPSQNWENISNPAYQMIVGKGYSLNAITNPTFSITTGNLNNGDISIPNLSSTAGGPNPLLQGFNLVGNPYISSIEWNNTWAQINISPIAWVWDQSIGNYRFADYLGGGTLAGSYIPPMQGFFVRATNTGSLTVPQSARTHGFVPFYKFSPSNRIGFTVEGNNYADAMSITLYDEATPGFDESFDAYKLMGIEEAPQIYSKLSDGSNLSGNYTPSNTSYVDVNFKAGDDGSYTITADGIESFNTSQPLYLVDTKEGNYVNLHNTNIYTFNYLTSDPENRFKMFFQTVGENEYVNEFVNIWSVNSTILVSNNNRLNGNVYVYDLLGHQISTQELDKDKLTEILSHKGNVVIVKVITDNSSFSRKIMVQ